MVSIFSKYKFSYGCLAETVSITKNKDSQYNVPENSGIVGNCSCFLVVGKFTGIFSLSFMFSIFNLPVIKGVPLVFANWEDIKHLYVIGKTPSQKCEESNQNIA